MMFEEALGSVVQDRGPEGGLRVWFGAGEGFGPLGFCSVTWFPFGGSRAVCRPHARDGVPWHCRHPSREGVGETCPRAARAFPVTPLCGQLGAHGGGPASWAHPAPSLPGGLSGARGRTLSDSWLSSAVRPSPASRPTRLSSPSRIRALGFRGSRLRGGHPWEGRLGVRLAPPSPSPARARPGDTAFAQKVIQQVLDRIPLFAYKDLFIAPPLRGRSAMRACSGVYNDY